MEGGRLLLAIALMIAVVVITNLIFQPAPVANRPAVPADTTPEVAGATPAPEPRDPVAGIAIDPGLADAETGPSADTVRATSSLFSYGFSTRGASLVSAKLLEHEAYASEAEGQPVELVPAYAPALVSHRLQFGQRIIDLSRLRFTPDRQSIDVTGDAAPELLFTHRDSASGIIFETAYRFDADTYVVDVEVRVKGAGNATPQLLIDLGPRLALNEAERAEDERALSYVVNNPNTGITSTSLNRVRPEQLTNGPLTWVALKSKYFLAAAMQSTRESMPFGGVIANPGEQEFDAYLTSTLLPGTDGVFQYRLYLGPQDFERLASFNNQLQDVSVFGWKFLQPVLRPLGHAITWLLLQMHRALGLGYGWVLVLFGFMIRVVLWPLNAKAMRSQMKNMEFQPRIKELQARYKTEPEKLQKEMLRLYKEEGFNPMGGCLPMLLPLPVLITLFFVFQSTIEFRGVEFLWLPDLSRADPFYILPVALGLSMFIQQWLNTRTSKDIAPQMKVMTYVMPVFLTVLFLNFASGLNLYYASMNIASVPQQLQIMKERKRVLEARGG
jgi:YidC/Oxa1 family membrane protein insertase